MALLLISFLAGVLTVLAPCILPLLPVVIGGSAADHTNRLKPYIITGSLAMSVIVFTLILKASTLLIDIPPDFWKWFSGTVLLVLGLVLVFPSLWERLSFTSWLGLRSQRLLATGSRKKSVWGDVLMGAALGPVFSTCSPTYFVILATVLPASFTLGLVYLFAYAAGLALMLGLIAVLGQNIVGRLSHAADARGWVKRGMGVLIILVGLAVISGYDKKLETALLDSGFFDITVLEQGLLERATSPTDDRTDADRTQSTTSAVLGVQAPEITEPSGFINTQGKPVTLADYRGSHVVLVDFWTYSCINCQRTLPYLTAWYEKYHDAGLEIVGVHTPEFAFEQKLENVQVAVSTWDIRYPVVLDNEYATWRAFGNRYWPRKYLIDEQGVIVYDHIGEGAYEETERAIQQALLNLGRSTDTSVVSVRANAANTPSDVRSPEIYFGAQRNARLGNGIRSQTGEQVFMLPDAPLPDTLYLDGVWDIDTEYAVSQRDAQVEFRFTAQDVYMVAAAPKAVPVRVYLDGVPLSNAQAGADVQAGIVTIGEERLYHLIELPVFGTHTLRLETEAEGVRAYTFTFG